MSRISGDLRSSPKMYGNVGMLNERTGSETCFLYSKFVPWYKSACTHNIQTNMHNDRHNGGGDEDDAKLLKKVVTTPLSETGMRGNERGGVTSTLVCWCVRVDFSVMKYTIMSKVETSFP